MRAPGAEALASAAAARSRAAFLWACGLDVAVRKPGNVSLASPGHGMQAAQFIASAQAAADGLCRPGATVGARIEAAVAATWAVAGCNTNLGIVLLCAPLAAAVEVLGEAPIEAGPLQAALLAVLAGLTVDDACAAFRAITQANPGGLGRAEAHDVRDSATVTLAEAMAAAADRDRIARQYRDGFAELFSLGLANAALPSGGLIDDTVLRVYLGWLASGTDSHIVRKHGEALAHSVMSAAQHWQGLQAAGLLPCGDARLDDWDAALKRQAINPGSSADLTVATLMLAALLRKDPEPRGTESDSR